MSDPVTIGIALAAIAISTASLVLNVLAMRRMNRNVAARPRP